MRAILAAHRAVRRDRAENVGELAFGGIGEAHVEIPFVTDRVGLQSAADRVLGETLEFGIPMRVDAPVCLKEAAHPVEHFRAAAVLRKFDRVVQAHQAASAFHLGGELLQAIVLKQQVMFSAVAEYEDGVGRGQLCLARPVGVEFHGALDRQTAIIEAFFEQEHPGIVFMLTWAVRWFAADQNRVLGSCGLLGEGGQDQHQ
jgi:hypothetical protein